MQNHDADASATPDEGTDVALRFASMPNPAIIIANGSGTVSMVDPATLTAVASVQIAADLHPHHVGVSPDGKRVLVTATSSDLSFGHGGGEHGGGHGAAAARTVVYQIDRVTRELRAVITVEATAHNAAYTRDGKTIVLAMMEHGMIAGFDASTFAEAFTATGFDMPLEVTPTDNGSLLVAESAASRIAVLDLASRTTTARFEVGAVPVAAWASGGGSYFVSVEEGMQVRHLMESGTAVTMDDHSIDPEGKPGQAILTPNGRELWVAVEDRGVIAIFDASTHDALAEIPAGTKPHGIAFDPSGARAFVTDEDAGKVLVIDVAARSSAGEVPLGGKPNGIAWLSK